MKFLILIIGILVISSAVLTEGLPRKLTPEYLQQIQFDMVDCVVATRITISKLVQINMKDLYSYEDPDILNLLACFYKKIGYADSEGNLQYEEIKQMFRDNFKLTDGQLNFLVDKCNAEGGATDVEKIQLFGRCIQRQSCALLGRVKEGLNSKEGCILGLYNTDTNSMITRKLGQIDAVKVNDSI